MSKIAKFIIDKGKIIIIVFFCLAIVGAVLMTYVKVNYDMSKYLPSDTDSKKSLEIMNEEFGENGTLSVMVTTKTLKDALEIKKKIELIPNIHKVMWIDDAMLAMKDSFLPGVDDDAFIDSVIEALQNQPELIPEEMRSQLSTFFVGDKSLFQVTFVDNAYAITTIKAIDEIKKLGDDMKLSGQSAHTYSMQKSIQRELTVAMIIIVPLLLLILFLATTSYFDPIIFIAVMAIAVLLNMGTNIFVGSISYLTNSIAALLQIAVSMDYSIFLLHSYKEHRKKGLSPKDSAVAALLKSFSPVSASSLTTIAGFCALMFMRFTLGFDIGLVLSKGILFSLITVFFFMPGFLVLTDNLITKGEHRNILAWFNDKRMVAASKTAANTVTVDNSNVTSADREKSLVTGNNRKSFIMRWKIRSETKKNNQNNMTMHKLTIKEWLSKGVMKTRFIIPILVIALVIPAFFAQSNNKFLYGDIASSGGEGSQLLNDRNEIEKTFGTQNNIVILLHKDNSEFELTLTEKLMNLECVSSAQSYSFILANAGDMNIESMESQFVSENYSRIILFVDTAEETKEAFAAADLIRATVESVLSDGYYLVGGTVSAMELKTINKKDYDVSTTIALLFILAILLVSTRSLVLPIILAAVIQSAIWINLAIPYLMGEPLVFLGYLIVSCFQMGCTIDYGILLTSNYTSNRKTMNKFDAARNAFETSLTQIALSASILMTVGFSVGIVASIPATAAIGIFLATGTLVSFILMTFVLPQLLVIFDKPIFWTTLRLKSKKKNTGRTDIDSSISEQETDEIEKVEDSSELF